jgi:hypothetical protein
VTASARTGPAAPPTDPRLGVVGNRSLVAVQTFDISRLTTHPVPVVPGVFVAVSGVGPDGDSNGSGKSSFLGAVSLLLGDAQWGLDHDGRLAQNLLFKPESAGVDPTLGYRPADYGYIVGVFAPTPPSDDPLVTVWLRLATAAPYVRARWTYGLHVAVAGTDHERSEQADTLWEALPRANELGSKRLAGTLYGEAPRCMAYLDANVRRSVPSLLSQQLAQLSPERIAEALIGLTGREHLLDTEVEQRRRLAEQKELLATREGEDKDKRLAEQVDLDGVHHRNAARAHLAEGERMWHLHFAKGLIDVLQRDAVAAEQVAAAEEKRDEARREQDEAREQLEELREQTDPTQAAEEAKRRSDGFTEAIRRIEGERSAAAALLTTVKRDMAAVRPLAQQWDGTPKTDLEELLGQADQQLGERKLEARQVEQQLTEARQQLRDAEAGMGGPAGHTLRILAEVGVTAVALLDTVTLEPAARAAWEPRLWAHREAAVIAAQDEQVALAALAAHPGASLILADGPLESAPTRDLPAGVHAGAPLGQFLHTLASRTEYRPDPDRAHDRELAAATLGGFETEVSGRAARVAAARARLTEARDNKEQADGRLRVAMARYAEAKAGLDAAAAAEQLATLTAAEAEHTSRITACDDKLAEIQPQAEAAHEAMIKTEALKLAHEDRIRYAERILVLRERETTARENELEKLQASRDSLNLDYWRTGWARGPEAAEQTLADLPDELRRLAARSLRHRAADALNAALTSYQHAAGGQLPPDLADTMARRRQLAEGFGGVGGDTVDFATLARPLRDLLDARSDDDQILEHRITRDQRSRADAIAATREETHRLQQDLQGLQDSIAERIHESLRRIGEAFNRLDLQRPGGHGADIKIEDIRPANPTDPWRWRVTPRWRRSPSSPLVSYHQSANSAQVKVAAIQLVLAALLATDGAAGRALVLDELGDSLGDVNRKQVLAAIDQVARAQGVTILGTCQDSVIYDAAGVCGQILWFEHTARTDAYNHPTRTWGFDPDKSRVEIVAPWLRAGRDG